METQSYLSKTYVQFLLSLALVCVIAALGAYAYLTLREAKGVYTGQTNITVIGEGEVLAKPDIGTFTFTVRAEGTDATEAQNVSAESMNEILAYLKDQGVEEKDVKTQYYNLNPKYRYQERICPVGSYCPPGEPIIDGYEVSQSVVVKVRDLENAGTLISGVGERGATNISGLQFTIDDTDVLKEEAREKAIVDAREKAEKLADALGMRLGRMTGFWEEGDGRYYPEMYAMDAMQDEAVGRGGNTAPSLPTGENTITSRVNISYELR